MKLSTKGNKAAMNELPALVKETLQNLLTEYRTRNWYFEQHPDGNIYQDEDSSFTLIYGNQIVRTWRANGEWSGYSSDPISQRTATDVKFPPGSFIIEHRIFMGKHLFTVHHVGVQALPQPEKEKVGADRGFTQIVIDLEKIENDPNEKDHKVRIMAEALHWGYTSARTNYVLEQRLYRLADLRPMVEMLAAKWDGQDYLNGALFVANNFYTERLY